MSHPLQFKFIHELENGAKVAYTSAGLIIIEPHGTPYLVNLDGKKVRIGTLVPAEYTAADVTFE